MTKVKLETTNQVQVRRATVEDVEPITRLCHQLGYSLSAEAVKAYLETLPTQTERLVYVAYQSDSVVGWINVYIPRVLLEDKQAEIGGLVVDEDWRSQGIGQLLVQQGQAWTKQQGCSVMQVRSRLTRQQAHKFYQSVGFSAYKTQHVFRQKLR